MHTGPIRETGESRAMMGEGESIEDLSIAKARGVRFMLKLSCRNFWELRMHLARLVVDAHTCKPHVTCLPAWWLAPFLSAKINIA